MAWDKFERDGIDGYMGDRPTDEFVIAFEKVVQAYRDRFSRKPSIHELLYSFERVLNSQPSKYVFTSKSRQDFQLFVRSTSNDCFLQKAALLDLSLYESAYAENPKPGRYLIEAKKSQKEVISVPLMNVEDENLLIHYRIRDKLFTVDMTKWLIRASLLKEYCDDDYADEVQYIKFVNLETNESTVESYFV